MIEALYLIILLGEKVTGVYDGWKHSVQMIGWCAEQKELIASTSCV